MKDKHLIYIGINGLILGIIVGSLCVDVYKCNKNILSLENRVTVLEQQLKESKQHADVKFELCMNRMVKK